MTAFVAAQYNVLVYANVPVPGLPARELARTPEELAKLINVYGVTLSRMVRVVDAPQFAVMARSLRGTPMGFQQWEFHRFARKYLPASEPYLHYDFVPTLMAAA